MPTERANLSRMAQRPTPPRGMRDLLPEEVATRRLLLGRIIAVYERYGFVQIETPLVEDIDRLLDSGGGENEKLIYKILRRGQAIDWPPASEAEAVDLGLRFDLTVPLARYFATNESSLPYPFKAIQCGSVFRAERPQKGRYRQFTQCDIDVIGDSSLMAEVELITATAEALDACEVGEFVIRMNDRRLLESLVSHSGFAPEQYAPVFIAVDKLDKIGVEGVHDELIRINDGDATKHLTETLEALFGSRGFAPTLEVLSSVVPAAVLEDLAAVVEGVVAASPAVRIELDATLVRGMGYYTGTIFEVEHAASAGSLGGGGRYDRMIEQLAGIAAPAAGFSIGFERLCDMLQTSISTTRHRRRIALLYAKDESIAAIAQCAQQLRANGNVVRREVAVKNRANQLSRLEKLGFTHWAELRDGAVTEVAPLLGADAPLNEHVGDDGTR